MVNGPFVPGDELDFFCVYATRGDSPSRLHFNDWAPLREKKEITHIAIEPSEDLEKHYEEMSQRGRGYLQTVSCMAPTGIVPDPKSPDPWFYTCCRLENTTEITVCIDETKPYRPIMGMLVQYSNGRRSCVGQYRKDWALEPMQVDFSKKLRIAMGQTERKFPFVANVDVQGVNMSTTNVADETSPLIWSTLPWNGKLEMWFTVAQSRIYHNWGELYHNQEMGVEPEWSGW